MILRCLTLLIIVALAAGCSSNERKSTTVSGKITYKHAPVVVGAIYFHGADEQVAMGNIKSDGSFTATDVPLGEVRVSLQVRDPGAYTQQLKNPDDPMANKKADGPAGVTSVPAMYADPNTSRLKYTISATTKEITVELD